jgi:hypothetical protein
MEKKKRTVNITKDVNGKNIRVGRIVSVITSENRGMRSAKKTTIC